MQQEELDGLIRCLRINNGEDIVPALPPFSIGIGPKKLMKHCGLNLRLIKGGFKTEHTTHVGPFGGVFSAMQNSIMKPIWNGLEWHLLPLHETRLEDAKAKLEQVTIDQLYKDPNVVGKNFLQGIVSDYDENEEGQEEL